MPVSCETEYQNQDTDLQRSTKLTQVSSALFVANCVCVFIC